MSVTLNFVRTSSNYQRGGEQPRAEPVAEYEVDGEPWVMTLWDKGEDKWGYFQFLVKVAKGAMSGRVEAVFAMRPFALPLSLDVIVTIPQTGRSITILKVGVQPIVTGPIIRDSPSVLASVVHPTDYESLDYQCTICEKRGHPSDLWVELPFEHYTSSFHLACIHEEGPSKLNMTSEFRSINSNADDNSTNSQSSLSGGRQRVVRKSRQTKKTSPTRKAKMKAGSSHQTCVIQ